jgi:hypothetical protein
MDRLTRAWEEHPGSLEDIAKEYVPEANNHEIKEVSINCSVFSSSGESARSIRLTQGRGVVPGGQQRVIRKVDPFS